MCVLYLVDFTSFVVVTFPFISTLFRLCTQPRLKRTVRRLVHKQTAVIFTTFHSLSAHADRQGVNISLTAFCVCLFVCMVTDFSAADKASGVICCTAVHRGQGISHFGNFAPQKPKIGRRIGQRAH